MKCLSLKQPWAWLMTNGLKDIENRKWRSNYRGRLLIQASKTWDQEGYDFIQNHLEDSERLLLPEWYFLRYDFGAIIGVVTMVDVVQFHPSKWFFGPWGFVFTSPEIWKNPAPYRGKLGIFDVPESVFKQQTKAEFT